MTKNRTLCPKTGNLCEGRQALIGLQTQLSIDAATRSKPNIVQDNDSTVIRTLKQVANVASRGATSQAERGMAEYSRVIDKALDAPLPDCVGSFCGSLGTLVLAYGDTFMPQVVKTYHIDRA